MRIASTTTAVGADTTTTTTTATTTTTTNNNNNTYSVEQIPSWDANWFSPSQEIPCIVWNPKVH